MLKLSQPNISEEAINAVIDVLRSGQLVHGAESDAFEQELASYLGCRDVVLVSSGAAALHLALLALNVGAGAAVIVPDFTFPATANAVVMVGARPIIVDVLADNYTLDPVKLEQTLLSWNGPEKIRAVMPVHEFGCVADMNAINRIAKAHGLAVVEDAACALGAHQGGQKAGTFGDLGCFSFHPRKTLTTGEGGAIATNSSEHASRLRRLRSHGMERDGAGVHFLEAATNYRLTNFQASLGRRQLPHLDSWIRTRMELADAYSSTLRPLAEKRLITVPTKVEGHSWQTFMIVLNKVFNRNEVIVKLRERNIEANLGAQSVSSIGIYPDNNTRPLIGPNLYSHGLALPMYEQMTSIDVQFVVKELTQLLTTTATVG